MWLRWRGGQHPWDKVVWGVLWERHPPKTTSPVFHLHLTCWVSSVGLSIPWEWVTIKEGLTTIPIPGDEPSLLGRHWQQSEGAGVHRAAACAFTRPCFYPQSRQFLAFLQKPWWGQTAFLQKVNEGEEEALWSHIIPGLGTPTPCSMLNGTISAAISWAYNALTRCHTLGGLCGLVSSSNALIICQ